MLPVSLMLPANPIMSLNTIFFVVISVLVIFSGRPVTGGRILLAGLQISSHLLELQEIGQALIKRGHSVYLTIDNNFTESSKLLKPGITPLTFNGVDTTYPQFWSDDANRALMTFILGKVKRNLKVTLQFATQDCTNMMRDVEFMSKVRALKFDLVLYDGFVLCPCNVILPYHLSIPGVSVTTKLIGWDVRVPVNPAMTPTMLLQYSDRMTFTQRLVNAAIFVVASVYHISERNTTLLQKFAPDVSSWTELQQRTTILTIATRDYLLEWPEPQMPNVIHTPGVTTHPAGVLPRQLRELMDAAQDGVIILSFGSITGQLPAEIIHKFLGAFSQFKQTVIFKYGAKNETFLSDTAKNVHMLSWLPQNDLLGHPNTVLFITHCGNNGQYESLYHGVPMIGFPLFGDQHHNAFRMVHHGYGVKMNIREFTVDELVNNIHKVLEEKSFKMAIQKASDIVKSRPMTAQDTAAYWVEHVLKYGGEHLRTGAMDMPLYQFLMLDILLFVLVVCLLSIYILKIIFAVIFRKCLRKKIKQKQQ